MDNKKRDDSRKCPYKNEYFNFSKYARITYNCPRSVHEDHEYCIFHSPRVEEKEEAFLPALKEYMAAVEGDVKQTVYKFVGFVFPKTGFHEKIFTKDADFHQSHFSGHTNFHQSQFSGYAHFSESQFSGYVHFYQSQFSGDAHFYQSQFSGDTNFNQSQFLENAYFYKSQFSGYAHFYQSQFSGYAKFNHSQFSGDAYFKQSQFSGDASFYQSQFSGDANFNKAKFKQRFDCSQAGFHNEVFFEDAQFAFLKNVDGGKAKGMHWEGAVLQETHLWGIDELTNHSFRDAFLLSLSLAGKRLVNCDFTGAVFDAVHTRGWDPDEATLANTKFIYTDYTDKDPDNPERKNYKPVPESRVPGDGDFGVGPNAGFDLKAFLRQPFIWSVTPNIPLHLRAAVSNYFNFFAEYLRVAEGIPVNIATHAEGERIRVEFRCDTAEEKERIRPLFEAYLLLLKQNPDNIQPEIHNPAATPDERDMLIIDLRHQVSTLQTKISYTERLLQKEEEKNQVFMLLHDPTAMMRERAITYSTQVYFLNADIAGFQPASQQDGEIHKSLSAFLIDHTKPSPHEVAPSKREGDCIKLFWKDGVELCFAADELLNNLRPLRRKHPAIKGMRIVLGCGLCERTEKHGVAEVAGDPITEACRADPLMKDWLSRNHQDPNQIWCTEAFKKAVQGMDNRITFEEIPEKFDLNKKDAQPGTGPDRLYWVNIKL